MSTHEDKKTQVNTALGSIDKAQPGQENLGIPELWRLVKPLRDAGHTPTDIAAALHKAGYRSYRGKRIWPSNVSLCALSMGGESYRLLARGNKKTRTTTRTTTTKEPTTSRTASPTMSLLSHVIQTEMPTTLKYDLIKTLSQHL